MRRALALLGLIALAACNNAAGAAQSTTDSATKSVYSNDVAGVDSNFDAALQAQVNRAQVGALSDKMHALGDYKGLSFVSNDASKNEYTYRADFANGMMNVVVR